MASIFLRAAGAGAACGLRTFSGVATTLSASGSPWTGLAIIISASELFFDKLPVTPSRLKPPGLTARMVAGAFCGGAVAARGDASRTLGALFGAVTAVTSAYTGHSIRRYLTQTLGWPDLPVALAEDTVAVLTARDANAFR